MKGKFFSLLQFFVGVSIFFLTTSCKDDVLKGEIKDIESDIVILYDNDVHCSIDGYAKIAGLRDHIQKTERAYVGIVSSGDYLQGGTYGAISKGEAIISIMNSVGYDAVTIGNHEFDYRVPRMIELFSKLYAPVTCVNYSDYKTGKMLFAPYILKEYGTTTLAFIGVATPETEKSEAYAIYDANGEKLYDLHKNEIANLVQKAVDNAKGEGADYIIILSHLGWQDEPYLSSQLVQETSGIDVVLDGHSHSVLPCEKVANKNGDSVIITQTGSNFEYVGKLIITPSGKISTSLISVDEIAYTSESVTQTIQNIKDFYNSKTDEKVGFSQVYLTINNKNDSIRMVRRRETNMGNFVTDAYKEVLGAQIGMLNAGGIRCGIKEGEIKYSDLINVNPFGDILYKIEVTGEQLKKAIEFGVQNVKADSTSKEGESGSFMQVSGIRYTIHINNEGNYIDNLQLQDGEQILPTSTYTLGTSDYVFMIDCGGILKDCKIIDSQGLTAMECFKEYIQTFLQGTVKKETYEKPQGRITIVVD